MVGQAKATADGIGTDGGQVGFEEIIQVAEFVGGDFEIDVQVRRFEGKRGVAFEADFGVCDLRLEIEVECFFVVCESGEAVGTEGELEGSFGDMTIEIEGDGLSRFCFDADVIGGDGEFGSGIGIGEGPHGVGEAGSKIGLFKNILQRMAARVNADGKRFGGCVEAFCHLELVEDGTDIDVVC